MSDIKPYFGENAEQNIKDDIKEMIHALNGVSEFEKLLAEVKEELDEANWTVWSESRTKFL